MATVAYNTKTNNPKVRKFLESPYGEELIRKLINHEYQTKDKDGNTVPPFITIEIGGQKFNIEVKELVSK